MTRPSSKVLTDTDRSHLSNARLVARLYEREELVVEAINDLLAIIGRLTGQNSAYERPAPATAPEAPKSRSASPAE